MEMINLNEKEIIKHLKKKKLFPNELKLGTILYIFHTWPSLVSALSVIKLWDKSYHLHLVLTEETETVGLKQHNWQE